MSPSSITLLTFASTTLLVVSLGMLAYEWCFRYRFEMRERLREVSPHGGEELSLTLFKDLKRLCQQQPYGDQTRTERLEQWLEQSGLEWSVRALGCRCLGGAVSAAALGYFSFGGWLAVGVMPFAAASPLVFVYGRRKRRQRNLCKQLPEAFQMVSRAVRAGQTVPSALRIIAQDFAPPISHEFALCYEQQNLGVSRESALRKLAQRTGIMELQIFVVALLVQAKSGGDLVELLDNLAGMVRKRLKLNDRVRALTGEGRMQALVLVILPAAAFVAVLAFAPEYARSLLDRPWLLAGTAVAQAMGTLWIRRIVNFEY